MRVARGGDRRGKAESLAAVLVAAGLILAAAAPARAQASPSLRASSSCANPGSSLTVSGSGFQPGVAVSLVAFGVPYSPSTSGSFSQSVFVPAATPPGTHAISANHAAGSAGITVTVPCEAPEPTTTTSEPVPTTTSPPTTRPPTTGPPTTRPVPTTVPTTVPATVVAPTMTLRPATAPAGATVVLVGTGLGQPCDVVLDADVDLASALLVTGDGCQPGADGDLQASFTVPVVAPGIYDVVLTARDLAGTPVQLVAPLTVTDCELPSESVILGMDPIAGEPGTRVLVTLAWRDVPVPCLGLAVELRFLGQVLGGGAAGGPGQVFEAVVPATVDEELPELELVRVDDSAVVGSQAFEVIGGVPRADDSSPWLGLTLLVGGMVVVFGAAVAIGAARTTRVPEPAPALGLAEPVAGGPVSTGERARKAPGKARVRARSTSPIESDPWDWKAVAAAVVVGVVGLVVLVRVISSSPERAGDTAVGRELGPVPSSIVSVTSSSSQADEVVADIVFTYGPANTLDGDPTTAWSHGTPGKGEGERLVYTFAEPVDLVLVEVVNGFNLNQEVFFRNGRVAELEITTDSGSEIVTLDDRPDPQQVEGAFAGTTTRVELEVVSVYPGSEFNNRPPFDDVSLSEVVFFGR